MIQNALIPRRSPSQLLDSLPLNHNRRRSRTCVGLEPNHQRDRGAVDQGGQSRHPLDASFCHRFRAKVRLLLGVIAYNSAICAPLGLPVVIQS